MKQPALPARRFPRPRGAAIHALWIGGLVLGTAATGTPPREDAWLRANTPHFIAFGQVDEPSLLETAARLERFRGALDAALPGLTQAASRPAYVFVFADAESAGRYLPRGGQAGGPGGAFFGRPDRDFLIIDMESGPESQRGALYGYARAAARDEITPLPSWLASERLPPPADGAQFDRVFAAYRSNPSSGRPPAPGAEPGPGSPTMPRTVPVSRAESLARLGDLLAQIDPTRAAAAEEHLRAALEVDPRNATALLAYARLEHRRGHWDAAAARYEAALDMGGPAAAAQYGWMLLDRWEDEHDPTSIGGLTAPPPAVLRARELFGRALALSPDDPIALHGLGRTYLFGQANDPAAYAALTRAHRLRPCRGEITLDLIRLDAASGRIEEARALADEALRRDPSAASFVSEAERAIAAAQVDLAADAADALRPDEGQAILKSALAQTADPGARGLLADQLSQFQASEAKRRLATTLGKAADAVTRGDYESAYRLYELAAEIADDPQVKRTASEMARTARKKAAVNRATARVAKAMTRANEGDLAGALMDLDAVLREEPGMPDALRLEATRARDRLKAALQRH